MILMVFIFNKEGKDKYGGYYDEEFNYHPGQEYLDIVKAIHDEHHLLEKYGFEEDEGEQEEEQFIQPEDFDDYLLKEKINPTLNYIKEHKDERHICISFKGMSNDVNDVKAYKDWFKERGVKPLDIGINPSRLNVRIMTTDEESIVNAIKLEGYPDVDIIKVYLPFLSSEKVGVEDDEDDAVEQHHYEGEGEGENYPDWQGEEAVEPETPVDESQEPDKPKEESKDDEKPAEEVKENPPAKVDNAEEDGFEISTF